MLVVLNINESFKPDDYIPIIQSREVRKLVGAVRTLDCFEYLKKVAKKLEESFPEEESNYASSIKYISDQLMNAVSISKKEGNYQV